jgi:Flp pilus assembly protein TadD
MMVSKVALVAALTACSSAALVVAPATAQPAARAQAQQPAQGQQAPERQWNLSAAERTALAPLLTANTTALNAQQAGQTADWAPVQALLPAALAAAQGADARYLVARVQLAVGLGTNNGPMQNEALDTLIASTATPQAELVAVLSARATRAFEAQDFATSERHFARLLELNPNDAAVRNNLAVVRQRMGNTSGAIETLMQTIQAGETSGQLASEDVYRRALSLAYTARNRAQTMDLAARLARNYPAGRNWRDAVRLYQQLVNPTPALSLDAMRLGRASGGLEGEGDYLSFAQTLDQAGLPGETKAVLDEGIARGAYAADRQGVREMLTTANRRIAEDQAGLATQITQARSAPQGRLARAVADALYGYGRYAEAAELYRLAADKGGEDRNLVTLRLGASLAMAGQRAEAETALRGVTGDAGDLARLWLAWLARRPS